MVEAPSCAHAQVFEAVLLSQISLSYHLTDQLCLCICLLQNTAYLCSGNTECSCGILLCFRRRWPLVCYTFSILQVPAQISCFLGLSCTDCHAQYCPKLNILSSLSTLSLGSLLVFLYAFSHLEFPFSVHLWLFRSTLSRFFFMVFVCLFVCSLFFFAFTFLLRILMECFLKVALFVLGGGVVLLYAKATINRLKCVLGATRFETFLR